MVVLNNGANSVELESVVGTSVRDLFSNETLTEMLNLRGDETVEVSSDEGYSWVNVSSSYYFRDGDEVRFVRSSGTKG